MNDRIIRGGTGYSLQDAQPLDDEIEHCKPDYTLYASYAQNLKKQDADDFLYAGIGFTTRGCFRHCPFCVNANKTRVERHSFVREFDDETRKYLVLLDDNIFGYSQWRDVFSELQDAGKPFVFKQGLDMRLMSKEKAQELQRSKYKNDIYFALDSLDYLQTFVEKATIFRAECNKPVRAYVLAGYDDPGELGIESAMTRIFTLTRFNILPYLMRYESCYQSPFDSLWSSIAAWCNQPAFFKKTTFAEFIIKRYRKRTHEQIKLITKSSTLDYFNRRAFD